jgi:hypothetical protein
METQHPTEGEELVGWAAGILLALVAVPVGVGGLLWWMFW